jgi:hypothetical protein
VAATVIQIGLDADVIDFTSPDVARFEGLTREKLRDTNDHTAASLRAAGYEVDNCLIDFGLAGAEKVRRWLEAKKYDAVLIGAGVRLAARNTLFFENIINTAHRVQPNCWFVFNYDATSTPDEIRRWFPEPVLAGA